MRNHKISPLVFSLVMCLGVPLWAQQPADIRERNMSKALEQLLKLSDGAPNKAYPKLSGTPDSTTLMSSRSGSTDRPEETPHAASQENPGAPTLQRRYPRYLIAHGDGLSIQFTFVPDFNQTATVQPDGFINLREVGDMYVLGLTTQELTERIRQAYSKILHEPVVTVTLTDFEKPYFIVGGEVGRPGKFDLRGDTTVTQAVQIAGGFTEKAKHSQVILFRRVSDEWVETRKLDLKKMLHAGNLTEDLHLQPGDMLFVPQNTISKIEKFLPTPHPGIVMSPSQL